MLQYKISISTIVSTKSATYIVVVTFKWFLLAIIFNT